MNEMTLSSLFHCSLYILFKLFFSILYILYYFTYSNNNIYILQRLIFSSFYITIKILINIFIIVYYLPVFKGKSVPGPPENKTPRRLGRGVGYNRAISPLSALRRRYGRRIPVRTWIAPAPAVRGSGLPAWGAARSAG